MRITYVFVLLIPYIVLRLYMNDDNNENIYLKTKYINDNTIQQLAGTYFTLEDDWILVNKNFSLKDKITIYKPNNEILAILYK